jgi:adenylate cyclase
LLGQEHNARLTPHDAERAGKCFHAALEREPDLGRAWVGLASSFSELAGFSGEPEPWDCRSVEAARRAVEIDPMDADAHSILGEGLGYAGEPAEAEAALERAVALNPSSADILARYSGWAPRFGKPERGAAAADRARLLNPSWPIWYNMYLCRAYFFAGRHADALAMVERKPTHSLHLQDLVYASASASILGRVEQARLWRERALALFPSLAAEWHARRGGTGIGHETQRRELVELMVDAGFARCATAEQAAGLAPSERLPECEAERAKAAAPKL